MNGTRLAIVYLESLEIVAKSPDFFAVIPRLLNSQVAGIK
jgi:hypothetical protein